MYIRLEAAAFVGLNCQGRGSEEICGGRRFLCTSTGVGVDLATGIVCGMKAFLGGDAHDASLYIQQLRIQVVIDFWLTMYTWLTLNSLFVSI